MNKACNVAVIGILVACASLPALAAKIKAAYDESANFSSYKTYAWGENIKPTRQLGDLVITGAIESELKSRNLQQETLEKADLVVRYVAASDADLNVATISDPTYAYNAGIAPNGSNIWSSGVRGAASGGEIRKGSLDIEVYDRNQRKLVWRAVASDAMDQDPKKAMEKVDKAITEMFKKYPGKK